MMAISYTAEAALSSLVYCECVISTVIMSFCMLQNVAPSMSMVEISAGIQGNDPVLQYEATLQCRKLLSRERERQPPVDDILQTGVIPKLITYLSFSDR